MDYYLAVDIGASSGRHMLGHLEDGKLVLEEMYRFPNGASKKNGHLQWAADDLFEHILEGMRRCRAAGKVPRSMGVDTWAVDFVLLDGDDNRLGDAVAYRDSRTEGADAIVEAVVPFSQLYRRTGIQKQLFNTVYQLTAVKRDTPELLDRAETFLMLPDYFHFLLTGVKSNEYTNATSTALVGAESKTWDMELIRKLGLPEKLFKPLAMPGTRLGALTEEIAQQVGFTCDVVLPATHDTGSAYLAVPAVDDQAVYLSSGTWSLMGIESKTPIISDAGMGENFTNEGGYDYRFRFLKNIMGLWMLQSVRRETGDKYTFPEIAALARESGPPVAIVDVNDGAFLAPASMTEAVKNVCRAAGGQVPETLGQVLQCIYHSLARSYADTVTGLEKIAGKPFTSLNIVGGGCQDGYLNELTARATGRTVYTGPIEGTVIGNLMVQMMADGEISGLESGRQIIRDSFDIQTVKP